MEVGPDNTRQEMDSQPDLLKIFANRVVTMFGFTGTLGELGDLCTRDLVNDPSITLQVKNEFVVKAANEAGLEIEPKYEPLFSEVIEQKGLERKFTVSRDQKSDGHEKIVTVQPKPSQLKAIDKVRIERLPEPRHVENHKSLRLDDRQLGARTMLLTQIMEINKEAQQARSLDQETVSMPRTKEINITRPFSQVVEEEVVAEPKSRLAYVKLPRLNKKLDQAARRHIEQPSTPGLKPVTDAMDFDIEKGEAGKSNTIFKLQEASVSSESISDVTAVILEELSYVGRTDDGHKLTDFFEDSKDALPQTILEDVEQYEDSITAYDEFIDGLLISGEELLLYAENTPRKGLTNEVTESISTDELDFIHPVLIEISGRLSQLEVEEKEFIEPVIKNIVDTIHSIHILEASGEVDQAIIDVEAQLMELCICLFEAMDMDYDEHVVKQFVQVLLYPGFMQEQPKKPRVLLANLENLGTHEAKYTTGSFSSSLLNARAHLEQIIGKFALVYLSRKSLQI
jgi:hypothetical protein